MKKSETDNQVLLELLGRMVEVEKAQRRLDGRIGTLISDVKEQKSATEFFVFDEEFNGKHVSHGDVLKIILKELGLKLHVTTAKPQLHASKVVSVGPWWKVWS